MADDYRNYYDRMYGGLAPRVTSPRVVLPPSAPSTGGGGSGVGGLLSGIGTAAGGVLAGPAGAAVVNTLGSIFTNWLQGKEREKQRMREDDRYKKELALAVAQDERDRRDRLALEREDLYRYQMDEGRDRATLGNLFAQSLPYEQTRRGMMGYALPGLDVSQEVAEPVYSTFTEERSTDPGSYGSEPDPRDNIGAVLSQYDISQKQARRRAKGYR